MRTRALKLLAFAPLAVCLASRNLSGAGQKVNGTTIISDDHVGSAVSIGAQGGGYNLDGMVGNVSSIESNGAGQRHVEAGYFTHRVNVPVLVGSPSVWITSMSVSYEDNNPAGSYYIFQLSTSSNFTGDIFSSATLSGVFSSTITNLTPGGTYYIALTAAYGEQDEAVNIGAWDSLQNYCGQMYSAGGGGPWSLPGTWDVGFAPTSCSRVEIRAGDAVTVDITTATASTTTVRGTLAFDRGGDSRLTMAGGDMIVKPGGHLDMGTPSSPIGPGIQAELVLGYGAFVGQYRLRVEDGGDFTAHGEPKSPFGLAVDPTLGVGATSLNISVSSSAAWALNDEITIGPTSGSGPATTELRSITGNAVSAGIRTLNFAPLTLFRDNTATAPIHVSNLTRNVVIRSSGTDIGANSALVESLVQNATSFQVMFADLRDLGAGGAQPQGLRIGDGVVPGMAAWISSSVVRNSAGGIRVALAAGVTLRGNVVHNSAGIGILVDAASQDVQVSSNAVLGGTAEGIAVHGGSIRTNLLENWVYSNNGAGVEFNYGASTANLMGSHVYSNQGGGVRIADGAGHTVGGCRIYMNSGDGVRVENSTGAVVYGNEISGHQIGRGVYLGSGSDLALAAGNAIFRNVGGITADGALRSTLFANTVRDNQNDGILLENRADDTWLGGEEVANNGQKGVRIWGSSDVFMAGLSVHENSQAGLHLDNAENIELQYSGLGYDPAGNELPDAPDEIEFDNGQAFAEDLTMRDVRISPSVGVSTDGLNRKGASIVSYNQDFDSGTIRYWGYTTVGNSTVTLNFSQRLYVSTATRLRRLRGDPAKSALKVCNTDDNQAVSELVLVEKVGGQWQVTGSSIGVQAAPLPLNAGCSPGQQYPASSPHFWLSLTDSGALDGDMFVFAVEGAADDQGRQKKFLAGPVNAGFHKGRSKLEIKEGSGWEMIGAPGYPTLMTMLPGSTYFHFVDSGGFVAVNSSISYLGPLGVEFSSTSVVYLATTTFDFMGAAELPARYITLRDVVYSTTAYGVQFGNSGAVPPWPDGSNVWVDPAVGPAVPKWTFVGATQGLFGEDYDVDASDRVDWLDASCIDNQTLSGGNWSDPTIWSNGYVPTACTEVTIDPTHTVNLDVADAYASSITIRGTLSFSRVLSSSLTMVGGDITVDPGGHLDMGISALPIPSGVRAVLILSSGSVPAQYGLIVKDGGDFTAYGAIKTAGSALSGAGAVAADIGLVDDPAAMGWAPGDRVVVGPAPGVGPGVVEERTITGLGANQITVNSPLTLTYYATETVRVVNLTRNVLIRSSGTDVAAESAYVQSLAGNATSFVAVGAEFAYLGGNNAGRYGVRANVGARLELSSCAVHHGYKGVAFADYSTMSYSAVYLNLSEGIDAIFASSVTVAGNYVLANGSAGVRASLTDYGVFRDNVVFANAEHGIGYFSNRNRVQNNDILRNGGWGLRVNGDRNFITGNTIRFNGAAGIDMWSFADGNDFFANFVATNAGTGISLGGGENRLKGNDIQANGAYGVWVATDSSRNVLELNTIRGNADTGIRVYGSSRTILLNNYVGGNWGGGVDLVYSTRSMSGNNTYAGNAGDGIRIDRSLRPWLANEFSYGNSQYGIWQISSDEVEYYGGGLGKDAAGVSQPNGLRELEIGAGGGSTFLYMQDVAIDGGDVGISTAGLDALDKSLASANQDGELGSLRLWGRINFDREGYEFDYNSVVFVSTVDRQPVLIRGAGHSATVNSTADDYAVSQIISIVYDASVPTWKVEGSSSGLLDQFPGSFGPVSIGSPAQFDLSFTEGSPPRDGDRLVFPLQGSTRDKLQRKKLLFGPINTSVNGGRSTLLLDGPGGGSMTLRGIPGSETLVDMIPGGTYYNFVASGPITAEYTIFRNLGPLGLEFSSNTTSVVLASSTFDSMGIADTTNTYITLRGLDSAATFYGLAFGVERSTLSAPYAYNIFIDPAVVNHTTWTLRRSSGALSGEFYDSPQFGNGFDPLRWTPFAPTPPLLYYIFETSATAQWEDSINDPGVLYNLEASSAGFAPGTVSFSSVTALSTATVMGLLRNTTYFYRVSAVDVGTSPYVSIATGPTLAKRVASLADAFLDVKSAAVTAAWAALPPAPREETAEGYVLGASSTNFDGSGVVFTSQTAEVSLSTLSVGIATPLEANTTYYFRVSSLNWDLMPNFRDIGSTSTLANAPPRASKDFLNIGITSITAQWTALPGTPQSATAEGYRLEASSTNFDGTGVVYSSATRDEGASTLTIAGLEVYTTYYFRVGSLNWNDVSSFTVLGATMPIQFRPVDLADGTQDVSQGIAAGDYDNDGDLDLAVANRQASGAAWDNHLLRNDGGGVFTELVQAGSGGGSYDVDWGDYDNDGDLDLLVTNNLSVDNYILRNDAGTFVKMVLSGTGSDSNSGAWGDYDNDGDLDMAFACAGTNDTYLVRNDGNGVFVRQTLTGTGGDSVAIAWGDYDNDGLLDLAVGNRLQNNYLLHNDGGGAFTKVPLANTSDNTFATAWGDYDNDGDLDVVFSNSNAVDLYVMRNDGGGAFTKVVIPGSATGGWGVAWGDYDGDGDLDLVAAGNPDAFLLRNEGNDAFKKIILNGSGGAGGLVWGDFDNDGDLDIVLSKSTKSRLMRNDGGYVNTPPAKPAFLPVDLVLDYDALLSTVTIKWDAGDYDGNGDTTTVYYALALATDTMAVVSADETRIVSPSSFPVTWNHGSPMLGHYLRPSYQVWPGDAALKHGVALRLDAAGSTLRSDATYYFRLQAVDQGLARSSWSVEFSSFVFVDIPPQNPLVSEVFNSSITVNYSTAPGITQYFFQADDDPSFASSVTSATFNTDLTTLSVTGLLGNTTYYLRMGGLYQRTTSYVSMTEVATLANPVNPGIFTAASSSTLTAEWPQTNPLNTKHEVVLGTSTPVDLGAGDTVIIATAPSGAPLSVVVPNLLANTTYYLEVRAINHAGVPTAYTIGAATATLINKPTDILVDYVSENTIILSAYAPTPDFRNLDAGLSGTEIVRDGSFFPGFHGSTWTTMTPMTGGVRRGLAAASVRDRIYAIGGFDGTTLSRTEMFTPTGNVWIATPSMTGAARYWMPAAVVGDKAYVFGGFTGGFSGNVDEYDQSAAQWTSKAAMVPARRGAVAVADAARVFVIGGRNGPFLASNQVYSSTANAWGPAAGMSTAREYAVGAEYAGKIFVIGGEDGGGKRAEVEIYDPANDSWDPPGQDMPQARGRAVAGRLGGKIYVIGGADAGGLAALNEEYDPSVDQWARRQPMITAREFAAAAVANGRIYVMGGSDGSDSDVVEEFDPGTSHVFSGLTPNSFYAFEARARNIHGLQTGMTALGFSTFTHAAVPSTATPSFTMVGVDSVTVQWTSNGNIIGTEYLLQVATAADFNGGALKFDSNWAAESPGDIPRTATSLLGNTTHYFRVRARNQVHVPTEYRLIGTTVTQANPPTLPVISLVETSSATFSWNPNGNGAGTLFEAIVSSDVNFTGGSDASSTTIEVSRLYGGTGVSWGGGDLNADTTYYFKARAINHAGAATAFTTAIDTITLAFPPDQAATPIAAVNLDSITFAWDNAGVDINPAWTLYLAEISTDSVFGTLNASTRVASLAADFGAPGVGPPLIHNTTYYLRVRAVNGAGVETSNTPTTVQATLAAPPLFPAPFAAVDLSSITFEFDPNGNPPGTLYQVDLSTALAPAFNTLNLTTFTYSTSVVFGTGGLGNALLQNTTHLFRVRTIGHGGDLTGFSATQSTPTLAAEPAPGTPPFPDVARSSLTFAWGAAGNPSTTFYDVELSTTPAFDGIDDVSSATANTAVIYGLGGAAPGAALLSNTTYYLRVRTGRVDGTSTTYTATQATATWAASPDVFNLTQVDKTSATLSWTSAFNPPGITVYEVQSSTEDSLFSSIYSSGRVTSMSIVVGDGGVMGTPLVANATHYFRVRAVNHNSIPSSFTVVLATVTNVNEPDTPLVDSVTSSSLAFSWGNGGNAPGTDYYAEISEVSNFASVYASSNTKNQAVDFGSGGAGTPLNANTTYYLRVQAVNAGGTPTLFTTTIDTITLAEVPSTTTFAAGDVDFSSITFRYLSSNPLGTTYYVQISSDDFSTFNLEVSTLSLSAIFGPGGSGQPLYADATYYFRVLAINDALTRSTWSVTAATHTPAAAPVAAGTEWPSVGITSVTWQWNANGNRPGTQYVVDISTDMFSSTSHSIWGVNTFVDAGSGGGVAPDLIPNATYYFRGKAQDINGNLTAGLYATTFTFAAAPGDAPVPFTLVEQASVTFAWLSSNNSTGSVYVADLSTTPAFNGTGDLSSTTLNLDAYFSGLASNATYYARVRVQGRNGFFSPYSTVRASATLALSPLTPLFGPVDITSARVSGYPAAGNSAGTFYEVQLSTDDFGTLAASSITANPAVIFGQPGGFGPALISNATYYTQVRALNHNSVPTAFTVRDSSVTNVNTPGLAVQSFPGVGPDNLTFEWTNGGNGPGTDYLAQISTDSFVTLNDSSFTKNTQAIFGVGGQGLPLNANSTYYLQVQAVNAGGSGTPFAAFQTTVTLVFMPTPAAAEYPSVNAQGLTMQWQNGGNPAGVRYVAEISTVAAFGGTSDISSNTVNGYALFGAGGEGANLTPNTSCYTRVRALNRLGTPTAPLVLNSTVTRANPPLASNPWATVDAGSITFQWTRNSNPTDTLFLAEISTDNFLTFNLSSATIGVGTLFGQGGAGQPLSADTTYYLHVKAISRDGTHTSYTVADSTATPPATPGLGAPTSLVAVEVSSISYLWSANGNPGGTDFEARISTDAAFASINLSSITKNVSVIFGFGGATPALSADTSYYFQVRTLGKSGTMTPFAASTNVFTLADVPAPDGTPFPNVAVASLTYAWARGANRVGTDYELQISTDGFATANDTFLTQAVSLDVGSGGAGQALEGAATYYLRVRAVNQDGIPTSYKLMESTYTDPAAPGTAAVEFPTVELSSITFAWTANGNRPGTDYLVEVSSDDYASLMLSSTTKNLSLLAGSGGAGAPLAANTTYYFRVAAYNVHGDTQAVKTAVSTVTLVATPLNLALPFTSVELSSITFSWNANGNGAGTDYVAQISTDAVFGSINITSTTKNNSVLFGAGGAQPALNRDTTYYFQVQALNVAGSPTPFTTGAATVTLVAIPDLSAPTTTFAQVFTNSIRYEWGANGNPAGADYLVEFALNPVFAPLDRSSFTKSTSALFGTGGEGPALSLNTTYYLRVRTLNHGGWSTPFTTVESTRTLPGDIYPPTITDNQAGDAVWRRANITAYDVDFDDFGGSKLDRFEVKTSTTLGDVIGGTWTVVNPPGGGINLDNYSTDWLLPISLFTDMIEGTTNYVSVRAFDGNANMSAAAPGQDVFFVQKDTTPPVFANTEAGGDSVPQSAAGKVYDVDVRDPASGIAAFEYSASTTPITADQNRIGWTTIALPGGATEYLTDWPVNFGLLLNDATNYISIRAWDTAGGTTTLVDAFFVMKDTGGPTIDITWPAGSGIWISTLPVVLGTASDFLGVQGAELSVKDNVGGNCWDGAGFTTLCPVWFAATGTVNWAYSQSIPLVDGDGYDIVARASDTAGNYSTNYSTLTNLTFDSVAPSAGLAGPVPDSTINVLNSISGTALDAGSGVAAVEVRIQRKTDNMYWDWFTETWNAVGVSTNPTGVGNWTIMPSEMLRANLADNTSYFIGVRVTDNAQPANQVGFFTAGSTFTFQDPGPPDAVTNLSALMGANPGEIDLSWTAPGDDPGGVGTILFGEFRIQHSTYVPVTFSSSSAQVLIPTGTVVPATTRRYTVGSLSPSVTYYLRIWTKDDVGNWSPISNGATTFAAPPLFNEIQGHVMNTSTEGITAVLVEAFDASESLVSSAFTVADGSGTWTLTSVPSGVYRVQATWTVDQISSAVWLDGVAMGSTNVDFVLNLTYTLSTLQGSLAGLGAAGGASPSFMSVAASNNFGESKVELFQNGRLAATVSVDALGKWMIPGLLPGKFGVRAFNGLEYTQMQEIDLLEGEVKTVGFVFDPLPEKDVFAFPNPALRQTTIRFVSALFPFEAQIRIFDIAGTLVREIPGGAMSSPSPSLYHAVWDLKNDGGDDVASGVYLFIVKVKGANGQSAKVIKKVAVVR